MRREGEENGESIILKVDYTERMQNIMMEFDYDKFYKGNLRLAEKYSEDKSEEGLKKWAEMACDTCYKEMITINVMRKLKPGATNADKFFRYIADDLMKDMPDELLPNIVEWINDEPISDIRIGKLSIKDIMYCFYTPKDKIVNDFIDSANAMKEYVKNGCKNEWAVFLGMGIM